MGHARVQQNEFNRSKLERCDVLVFKRFREGFLGLNVSMAQEVAGHLIEIAIIQLGPVYGHDQARRAVSLITSSLRH